MPQDMLYLRREIQAEPLFHSWYAWTHLIAPATAARYITDHYHRILESYVRGPQFHANALKDPKMVGGPFVDCGGKRVEEVQALIERTKNTAADLFELSFALRDLGKHLQGIARGTSLGPVYENVPAPLKGYVELIYDANNSASYRVIEALLYESKYYDESAQSLLLSITTGDERPFVLSTPRLGGDNAFSWQVPFSSPNVDQLFELASVPRTWEKISSIIGPMNGNEALVRTFFTTEAPPAAAERFSADGARWRYFGHACVMVETAGTTILTDPAISYGYDSELARFTFDDLPRRIDYVVITHNHQDHVMLETLLRLRHRIGTIVLPHSGRAGLHDISLRQALQRIGFARIVELDEMETLYFNGGSITGLPFLGEHGDLNIQSKLAHLIRAGEHTILFAADSCGLEPKLYDHIRAVTGKIDTLFVGMECEGAPMSWVYGPLMTQPLERSLDRTRRLNGSNCEQAMAIVDALGCEEVFVYALGQEPWLGHVMGIRYTPESPPIVESDKLIALCKARGVPAERLLYQKEAVLAA
jgi:L-ascorbate metabolism protein UlaG (beta-lactamase superfamily)